MNYSAVIVLGNLMSKSGKLNSESSSRMDISIEAFQKKQVSFIITCGWAYRRDSSITIADAMKTYAIDISRIPASLILTEKSSRDTVGDAIFTKKNIALKNGWKKVLVATSDYHIARTHEIFTFVYGKRYSIKVVGAFTDRIDEHLERERNSLKEFKKTFRDIEPGDDTLIYNRLCEEHPYYNGTVHPKISTD